MTVEKEITFAKTEFPPTKLSRGGRTSLDFVKLECLLRMMWIPVGLRSMELIRSSRATKLLEIHSEHSLPRNRAFLLECLFPRSSSLIGNDEPLHWCGPELS